MALVALTALGIASTARAEPTTDSTKLACAVAYEQGQRLRKDGRLLAARAQLLACSDAACPSVLQGDCTRWLTELDLTIPTVLLSARDASGAELSDVRVELDGKLLTTSLDGKPVQVDPGVRNFRFFARGKTLDREVTLEPGDQGRAVSVSFGAIAKADAARSAGGVPTATWVLAGVGVIGVAGFGYFSLDGRAKKDDLERCKPRCDPADVDAARRSFVIGDVFLAVGLSALAGATIVYATAPKERPSGLRLSPALGVGSASILGRF
ncbi:MAG: hypothetical protein HS104_20995 [Polyangiaceae bacterium]|nr:hypothetical protein [Polyangiaceae bacterium]MCL4749683.1 hypothetical protein [Myxococcales bacterium]